MNFLYRKLKLVIIKFKLQWKYGNDTGALNAYTAIVIADMQKMISDFVTKLIREAADINSLIRYKASLEAQIITTKEESLKFTLPKHVEGMAKQVEFLESQIQRLSNRIEQIS